MTAAGSVSDLDVSSWLAEYRPASWLGYREAGQRIIFVTADMAAWTAEMGDGFVLLEPTEFTDLTSPGRCDKNFHPARTYVHHLRMKLGEPAESWTKNGDETEHRVSEARIVALFIRDVRPTAYRPEEDPALD